MRARSGESDDLRIDAFVLEHLLAIRDVAMTLDGHVVVTRIVDAGIALFVHGQLDDAVSAAESVQVFGRIEMIVDVNQHW